MISLKVDFHMTFYGVFPAKTVGDIEHSIGHSVSISYSGNGSVAPQHRTPFFLTQSYRIGDLIPFYSKTDTYDGNLLDWEYG